MWGATGNANASYLTGEFQSTRPVWGATDEISKWDTQMQFQSTRPVWGATGKYLSDNQAFVISIHAPRVGRDIASLLC